MSRMADNSLVAFQMLGSRSECYYCGAPKKGYDTTPHRSVMEQAPESMERVVTAVCTSCAQRIHYANMVLDHSTKREGADRGMMSFDAKKRLCQAARWSRVGEGQRPAFVFNQGLVVPSSMTMDDGVIYVDGVLWSMSELRAMQGPLALKMIGSPMDVIAECFWSLVVADEVSKDIDVEKCKAILGI